MCIGKTDFKVQTGVLFCALQQVSCAIARLLHAAVTSRMAVQKWYGKIAETLFFLLEIFLLGISTTVIQFYLYIPVLIYQLCIISLLIPLPLSGVLYFLLCHISHCSNRELLPVKAPFFFLFSSQHKKHITACKTRCDVRMPLLTSQLANLIFLMQEKFIYY